jgi:hypothetical protein
VFIFGQEYDNIPIQIQTPRLKAMPAPGTEMQARFALEYVANGGKVEAAAIAAGYSERSAYDLGRRALNLPHVQALILDELNKQRSRSGVVGLSALIEIASNEKAAAAARVAAARTLIEHAGLIDTAKESQGARLAADLGAPAPDYKSILDAFANLSSLAAAAKRETLQ